MSKSMSLLFRFLINDNVSLKHQLLVIYFVISALSCGITLAICYSLLYSLKDSTVTAANKNLIQQTSLNSQSLAAEIANAINQEFVLVGESICTVSAFYSSILLTSPNVNTSSGATILKHESSYREYNFNGYCNEPKCPNDYGLIAGRSRIPRDTPGFIYGSLLHSSVYLYSSTINRSIRDDKSWDNITDKYPVVKSVVNALAYQDQDLELIYTRGPNTTLMFQLSAQINLPSGQYLSVHRTYPGLMRNSTTYNPPKRPWFTVAKEDSYGVIGPYMGFFIRTALYTLAAKKTVTDPNTKRDITVVASADLSVAELSSIVNSVQYTYGGFGVLIAKQTLEVLVWKNSSITNSNSSKIYTVHDFDPYLASRYSDLTQKGVFEYSDPQGLNWIVAAYPFFVPGKDNIDPSSSLNNLVILVFAQRDLALKSLDTLNTNIASTTSFIIESTCITIAATVAATLVLVFLIIQYMSAPLEGMLRLSEELIQMSAEDDENKDYRGILLRAYCNLQRTDEIGILAIDYYYLVCMLHNKHAEGEERKFPLNPFHIPPINDNRNTPYIVTRPQFFSMLTNNTDPQDIVVTHPMDIIPMLTPTGDNYWPLPKNQTPDYVDLELAARQQQSTTTTTTTQNSVTHGLTSDRYIWIPNSKNILQVGWLTSLKSQLYFLSVALLAGVIITMIVTAVSLSKQGYIWMSTSTTEINNNQILNMQAITVSKSAYVTSYYQQLTVDLLTAGAFLNSLLSHNLTDPNWYRNGRFIPSYSCNVNDNKHKYSAYKVPTKAYSLYYSKDFASCKGQTCDVLHNSTLTTLTSLADLKLRSFFHKRNFISSVQLSLEQHAFTRFLPLLIADYDPNNSPPYNPHNSQWYRTAKVASSHSSYDSSHVFFQVPSVSSSSSSGIRQLGFIPVRNATSNGMFSGVVSINYDNSRKFAQSINQNRILSSGYCYVIDTNSSALISHPNLSPSCVDLKCAEGFSDVEYRTFKSEFLLPLKRQSVDQASYTKGGSSWRLATTHVVFGTVDYTVVATVSNTEIESTAQQTTNAINATINSMEIIFGCCIFACVVLLVLFSRWMIALIVHPINDLRDVLAFIRSNDLSRELPGKASSKDMKLLLDAFTKLLVALRFSSDAYLKGDHQKALSTCSQALQYFQQTGNKRGIGACENNLSATFLSIGDVENAERHCNAAIKNATDTLQSIEQTAAAAGVVVVVGGGSVGVGGSTTGRDLLRAQQTLSDRKGNLAVIYLQRNNFAEAFRVLEEVLVQDRSNMYFRGLVVKHGTLGHYYLKQGELASAERVFLRALDVIRNREEYRDIAWSNQELDSYEQIALFNIATLEAAKAPEKSEEAFLVALCKTKFMHTATVTKILLSLKKVLERSNRTEDLALLSAKAAGMNFNIDYSFGSNRIGPAKRVSFVIDYSGSMSGPKIRSAIENVQAIFANRINHNDQVAVTVFSEAVRTVIPLTVKVGNESSISSLIAALTSPSGGTALYKALLQSIQDLQAGQPGSDSGLRSGSSGSSSSGSSSSSSCNWIIALTDGEDNRSGYVTAYTVAYMLQRTDIGLIIIGVGADVKPEVLQAIAEGVPNSRGYYVFAEGDKKSIDSAFNRAVEIIESNFLDERL